MCEGSVLFSLAELDLGACSGSALWIEPCDQFGKFGFEALVVVVGTLAHDVTHHPIAIGGPAVLAAGLVHDAEAVPAVRLIRSRASPPASASPRSSAGITGP